MFSVVLQRPCRVVNAILEPYGLQLGRVCGANSPDCTYLVRIIIRGSLYFVNNDPVGTGLLNDF